MNTNAKSPQAERRARTRKIIARLERAYPDATCALHHTSALQLVVATILSAQCTDKRVNMVTPTLFAKYRTAKDYVRASPATLEKLLRPTGFFRAKTKSIRGAAAAIETKHAGRVPDTMEELHALPGVGRKTANVVLGNAFGKNEGIVVDTHVVRLSRRLRLTRETDPEKIERDLMKLVPREHWTNWSHWLIWHGRRRCFARKPDCRQCEIFALCPSGKKFIQSGEALPPPSGT
jgi:endonuclease-3